MTSLSTVCISLLVYLCSSGASVARASFLRRQEAQASVRAATEGKKVLVEIYHEASCPYCNELLGGSVKAIFEDIEMRDLVDFRFFPFGNARFVPEKNVSEGYHFWHPHAKYPLIACQHGSSECLGNMIQAFAIDLMVESERHVPYLICMAELAREEYGVELASYNCSKDHGVDLDAIKACVGSERGWKLIESLGKKTELVGREHVPWVMINGEHSADADEDMLLETVCKALAAHKPRLCTAWQMVRKEVEQQVQHQAKQEVKPESRESKGPKEPGCTHDCLVQRSASELAQSGNSTKVEIFYESQCPDCHDFFIDTLESIVNDSELQGRLHLTLYPYGFARMLTRENVSEGYMYWHNRAPFPIVVCQHGESECFGNMIQACAIDELQTSARYVPFISCMAKKNSAGAGMELASYECAKQHSVDIVAIKECVLSQRGRRLTEAAAERTQSVGSDVDHLPYILINGEHMHRADEQTAAPGSFLEVICDALEPKPLGCLRSTQGRTKLRTWGKATALTPQLTPIADSKPAKKGCGDHLCLMQRGVAKRV